MALDYVIVVTSNSDRRAIAAQLAKNPVLAGKRICYIVNPTDAADFKNKLAAAGKPLDNKTKVLIFGGQEQLEKGSFTADAIVKAWGMR